jgi:hypothetical protein
MPLDDYAASLAAKSDAELAALEKDRSLDDHRWAAVSAERVRRAAAAPRAAPPAPPPPAAAAGHAAPAAPPAGDDPRLEAALQHVRDLLVPGETLEGWAVQRRLFALLHRRRLVAATSGRVVVLSRALLGGFDVRDVRWQDLRDAALRVGIFGADLTIGALATADLVSAAAPGGDVVVTGLRKEDAHRVYRLCQAQEQGWREKRRVRDLDELRARSGGIQLGAAAGAPPAAGDGAPAERLRRAREMLAQGLISDAEYESIKARVVEAL